MAFSFTDLLGSISPGGANLISTGLNLVGNLVGGDRAQEGYDNAAAATREASAAALAELKRGKEAGIGHINQGVADYSGTIAPLMTERPILLPQYRGLTTQQEMGRQDLMRSGQAALAASGLRGAGRGGVGTVLDSVARYTAGARDQNDAANRTAKVAARSGADAARTGLASIQANAGTAKANAELGVGSQNASTLSNTGQSLGNLAVQSGNTGAAQAVSTGQLAGNAVQFGAGYGAGNSPNQPSLAPYYGSQPKTDDNQPKV